jgi:hypothetical protein
MALHEVIGGGSVNWLIWIVAFPTLAVACDIPVMIRHSSHHSSHDDPQEAASKAWIGVRYST